jgi:hypothetical protein
MSSRLQLRTGAILVRWLAGVIIAVAPVMFPAAHAAKQAKPTITEETGAALLSATLLPAVCLLSAG